MNTKQITAAIGALSAALILTSCGSGGSTGPGLKLVAQQLEPFQSCDQYLTWQIKHNLDQVGPYGWGGDLPVYAQMEKAAPDTSAAQDQGQASSANGTNTQETDVDEPDFAKTNGGIVVSVRDNSVVATDVTGPEPRELGRYTFPSNTFITDLLLVGDHVIATADTPMMAYDAPMESHGILPVSGTTIHDLNFSNPSSPELVSTQSFSGRRVSARQYGDVVRLVLADGLPQLDFVQPRPGLSSDQATAKNRDILKQSQVEDWLPTVTTDGSSEPLVDCADVRHPNGAAGGQTLTVVTFAVADPGRQETLAITAAGDNVYSSSHHLYITSTNWSDRPWLIKEFRAPKVTTDIHEFTLDGLDTKYVATGQIQGTVRDQWSLDEYDGDLRVARSTVGTDGATRDNGVVILRRDGDRLKPIGQINSLGIDEEIQSVRWMDDLAVVVTFRQMDPLYTLDLSDPKAPRMLGELKIPGFSAYLHPIGEDQLIGIGVDATDQGRQIGAQLATFDLSDLSRVRQTQVQRFGYGSNLMAANDPKAFTWLPASRTAYTSLQDGMSKQLLRIKVAPDGTFTTTTYPLRNDEYEVRSLPLPEDRVAVVSRNHLLLLEAAEVHNSPAP